jgi:hypothetical protein
VTLHPNLQLQKVRSLSDELPILRKALARHKSAECALRLQKSTNAMNDAARELRAGFKLHSFR